jgi:hypothetical protein
MDFSYNVKSDTMNVSLKSMKDLFYVYILFLYSLFRILQVEFFKLGFLLRDKENPLERKDKLHVLQEYSNLEILLTYMKNYFDALNQIKTLKNESHFPSPFPLFEKIKDKINFKIDIYFKDRDFNTEDLKTYIRETYFQTLPLLTNEDFLENVQDIMKENEDIAKFSPEILKNSLIVSKQIKRKFAKVETNYLTPRGMFVKR